MNPIAKLGIKMASNRRRAPTSAVVLDLRFEALLFLGIFLPPNPLFNPIRNLSFHGFDGSNSTIYSLIKICEQFSINFNCVFSILVLYIGKSKSLSHLIYNYNLCARMFLLELSF